MTIDEFIKATGYSLTKLSRLAGVNHGHLHACYTQKRPVGAKVARALAAVIGPNGERISVEDAIALHVEPEKPAKRPRARRAA